MVVVIRSPYRGKACGAGRQGGSACRLDEFQLDDRAVVNELVPALDLSVVGDQAIHFRIADSIMRALLHELHETR